MYRDKASLQDILAAGQDALNDAQNLTPDELKEDSMRLRAIAYSILVIGEATTRLSSDLREKHPDIPWKRMVGMRNVMAHQYDNINLKILWSAVNISIPEMLKKIESVIVEIPD